MQSRNTSIRAPKSIRLIILRRASYFVALTGAMSALAAAPGVVTYDTSPYYVNGKTGPFGAAYGGIFHGTSTTGQTFVAPDRPAVTLDNFTFYVERLAPDGTYTLNLKAFVFTWSGPLFGPGGGAVGSALYMSPSFAFNPAPFQTWHPLTATIPGGVALNPGQHYVMGFTLSDPADYALSSGYSELQIIGTSRRPTYNPPNIPDDVAYGGGGKVWMNNGNNFDALSTRVWDTFEDFGTLSFTAHFTVIPEPSILGLAVLGAVVWAGRFISDRNPTLFPESRHRFRFHAKPN